MKKLKYVLAFLFVLIVSLVNIKVIYHDDGKTVTLSMIKELNAQIDPTKFVPHHFLTSKTCWYFNAEFDGFIQVGSLIIPTGDVQMGTNGDKFICKEIAQEVYCEVAKQTRCLPRVD